MNRILNYDKFKLRKSKYLYICMIISVCLIILALSAAIVTSQKVMTISVSVTGYFNIVFSSISPLIFSIIICIFVGSDFKDGTIKNVISKSISRENIAISKAIWIYTLTILFVLINVLVGFLTIISMAKVSFYSSDFVIIFRNILISILQMLSLSSMFMFISFLAKSPESAIAISIAANAIIPIIVTLIDGLIIKANNMYLSNMLPFFATRFFSQPQVDKEKITMFIIAMIVEIILFFALSVITMKKSEIK